MKKAKFGVAMALAAAVGAEAVAACTPLEMEEAYEGARAKAAEAEAWAKDQANQGVCAVRPDAKGCDPAPK